ncbi:tRNA(Ile)(2)-agmatinylcytidine synthase [Halorussus litoreus]|uniref:tRNA(Ile)(2)-agmatinylcytidine synthase n=1 Tax=Halorussus litoreus TaxID=1710536 RepID=UPI000E27AC1A|nr:tRNA(Ile)(2)-agmatinylcytidine synthase [Halorussus litoreus]
MTVIGVDDTDSRERGMCTTYLAARIAERLREESAAAVERLLLVRLNPAVEHKTRGNAALAIHTDADPEDAFEIAREEIDAVAETDDPRTNPGLVVAPGDPEVVPPGDTEVIAPTDPEAVPESVADFAREAVRDHLSVAEADARIADAGYLSAGWKRGRGKIGAPDWTYECISYRESERVGTPREVDAESVFAAANAAYPEVWDTVDRETGELVCVPHTPGPILHGIRGDSADCVRRVARMIESEPVERRAVFVTNQGTDAHLQDADRQDPTFPGVEDGRSYRVSGAVATAPETRRGGHVFVGLAARTDGEDGARDELQCAAFEPTKRFRDRVRDLRPGDRITACGEVSEGTLKLEKFAVRELNRTELVTPDCPDCDRSMKSAGAGQGYRCRDCGTTADGKVEREVERELEVGWYEVPPEARRHIAKPLVRGEFDAPIHPEK